MHDYPLISVSFSLISAYFYGAVKHYPSNGNIANGTLFLSVSVVNYAIFRNMLTLVKTVVAYTYMDCSKDP